MDIDEKRYGKLIPKSSDNKIKHRHGLSFRVRLIDASQSFRQLRDCFGHCPRNDNSYCWIWAFLILFSLTVIISPGCKGKEEKQPATELAASGEQTKEGISETNRVASGTSETIPSEVVRNTPPKITSLDLSPRIPVKGDKIKSIVATFDNEGDTVNLTYEWSQNDVILFESSDSLLLTDNFRSGDKITLRVIPDDGKGKGNPISVVITIANAPPVIHPSQETFKFDGSFYSYQVKASDADGDPLTYSLKSSPPGMTINSKTGLVEWNVPPDFKGKAPITILVSDGHGGEVMQGFTLEIKPEQKN